MKGVSLAGRLVDRQDTGLAGLFRPMLGKSMAPRLMICLALLTASAACANVPLSNQPASSPAQAARYQAWQVIETASGQPVDQEAWLRELTTFDIVYLGEEHHNRHHVEAAVRVLRSMVDRGHRPVLAMEMFAWDGQPGLDRQILGEDADQEQFLQEARWRENWGGSYEDYAPLIRLAREQRLPVLALNAPLSLVRRVAKAGLAGVRDDPEVARWGMKDEPILDDPVYRDRIIRQLQQCHGGGSESLYERMYEASMFRDESMAKTLVQTWRASKQSQSEHRPIVSYTGGGHIQYNLPIPKRVARRADGVVRQVTVYMTSYEDARVPELRELMKDGIADFLWLTPMSDHGPPRRC